MSAAPIMDPDPEAPAAAAARRVRRRARRTAGAPSLAASELSVAFERRGDVVVARLAGNLDLDTALALQGRLATVIGTPTPVVLDLSRIDRLDSSGLGALIALCNRAVKVRQGVALVSGDAQLLDVLGIAGLHDAVLHARNVGSACSLLAPTSLPAIR